MLAGHAHSLSRQDLEECVCNYEIMPPEVSARPTVSYNEYHHLAKNTSVVSSPTTTNTTATATMTTSTISMTTATATAAAKCFKLPV